MNVQLSPQPSQSERAPTPPNWAERHFNDRIHKAVKIRRFHERHATRQRRLAQSLIADAQASGIRVWE